MVVVTDHSKVDYGLVARESKVVVDTRRALLRRLSGGAPTPAALTLTDTIMSSTGVAIHLYRRAGKPNHGSFQLEHPVPEEIERRRRIDTLTAS